MGAQGVRGEKREERRQRGRAGCAWKAWEGVGAREAGVEGGFGAQKGIIISLNAPRAEGARNFFEGILG